MMSHTWTFDKLNRLMEAHLASPSPLEFTYFAKDDLEKIRAAAVGERRSGRLALALVLAGSALAPAASRAGCCQLVKSAV